MRKIFSQFSRALVAGAALSAIGFSASAEALASEFSFRIVETDGKGNEVLVERGTVRPGEIISYELRHENKTEDALAGLVIAAPVPEGVTLNFDGQTTSVDAVFEVQAELDPEQEGLEWSTLPAVRKVVDAEGNAEEEPLPEGEVVAVRWTFSQPLEAGATAFNSYRVRVD